MKKGYKPINTVKSTKWALKNFAAWREARVKANLDACPDNILLSFDPNVLCQWLSRYAAETRTTAGKSYPPSTVYQLLTGELRHMHDVNPNAVRNSMVRNRHFLNKQDA